MLGGRQVLRQMAFPLFFLIFVLPYPGWVIDSLTQPLKLMISQGAEWLLYLAGYPVARSGVLISLGQYRLMVADACSGLHSLIFLSALGLLYIHFTGPRRSLASVVPDCRPDTDCTVRQFLQGHDSVAADLPLRQCDWSKLLA